MAKIFSILTLLVAGVAIYFALEGDTRVKEMQASGRKLAGYLKDTEAELTRTRKDLADTKETLTKTSAELAETKEKLRTTEETLTKTKADYDKANGELTAVNTELKAIKQALEDAFPGAGLDGIEKIKGKITELTELTKKQQMDLATLQSDKTNLENKVADLEGTRKQNEEKIVQQGGVIDKYKHNIMVKGIKGRVEAVNAGWGFCVISIGDKQGAATGKVLIVTRNGQAIGKVKITNVEANQSVADILPSTFVRGTFIAPGDGVIYTGEDKAKIDDNATAVAPTLPIR